MLCTLAQWLDSTYSIEYVIYIYTQLTYLIQITCIYIYIYINLTYDIIDLALKVRTRRLQTAYWHEAGSSEL